MRRRSSRPSHVCGILLSMLLVAATHAGAQAKEEACPWAGRAPVGIGIERLRCVGGECQINLTAPDGRLEHRFSTEPRIDRLWPSASDAMGEGDVIVSIDGRPITTRAGGRRLARLTLERDVTLGLRRGERFLEVRLSPRPGCPIGGLAVRRASESR